MCAIYQKGQSPLPEDETLLDPDAVARIVSIARILIWDKYQFIRNSGFSEATVLHVLRGNQYTTRRTRADLREYATQIIREHKQTLFDYMEIEDPVEIPEAVYPYSITRTIELTEMPEGFLCNRANPFGAGDQDFLHDMWNVLYRSIRPYNSPYIHLYGIDLVRAKGAAVTSPVEHKGWAEQLLNGPRGYINGNSTIANPVLLDRFAELVGLNHNIWGNSLRQGVPDITVRAIHGE